MNSRARILSRIQAARDAVPERAGAVASAPPGQRTAAGGDLLTRFTTLAAATDMTVAGVTDGAAIPGAVAAYLRQEQLDARAVVDPTVAVAEADWGAAGLHTAPPPVAADGDVYVGAAVAALADCGALVVASGAQRALSNEFLAATHIAVVARHHLLASQSGLWALLRERAAAARIPRAVVMITGPSRTADLGVPARLGAHGPARVHVLVVDEL